MPSPTKARTRRSKPLPADLAAARRRFAAWRRTRRPGARIPEPLWELASQRALRHGISRTATALGLSYYTLKGRAPKRGRSSGRKSPRRSKAEPASFVSVPPLAAIQHADCLVKFEDGRGARLRVRWKGAGAPDVGTLGASFFARRR